MLETLLLVLAPTAFPAPAAEPPPSLATLVTAPMPALPQGYDYGFAPAGWVSVGISWMSSSIDQDTVDDPDSENPIGADLGIYGWEGEVGLGLEAGVMHSTYEGLIDSLTSEEVDVWRTMVGLRLADRGSGDRFLPWARAGFLYRFDNGDVLGDDGPGFYIGAGFDFVLIGGLAVTPQFMYQQSSSFGSEEWIGTLSLSYLF